jgi:hypothetical protein
MRHTVILAILTCLAVATPAEARIVVNQRIGAARLSLSDDQVIDRLGEPDKITYREMDFGGPSKTFHYFDRRLTVKFYDIEEPRVAWSVTTKSAGERTKSGLGLGSAVGRVRHRLDGEVCHLKSGDGSCAVIRHEQYASRKTVFHFLGGHVSAVTLRYFY